MTRLPDVVAELLGDRLAAGHLYLGVLDFHFSSEFHSAPKPGFELPEGAAGRGWGRRRRRGGGVLAEHVQPKRTAVRRGGLAQDADALPIGETDAALRSSGSISQPT